MEKSKQSSVYPISSLGLFSFLWLIASEALAVALATSSSQRFLAVQWIFIFWVLSILDLVALAKTLSSVMGLINSSEKSELRATYMVQTLCWGFFKLACLGLFILVLLKGQNIPWIGLLLGMGTLVVVPVMGGFVWSQRALRNA